MSANKSYADKLVTGARLSYFWSKLKVILLKKADSATTLEGYGITDAYTTEQVDEKIKGIPIPEIPEMPDMSDYATTQELKALSDQVGDISSALDELHAHAESLISGGEAQ